MPSSFFLTLALVAGCVSAVAAERWIVQVDPSRLEDAVSVLRQRGFIVKAGGKNFLAVEKAAEATVSANAALKTLNGMKTSGETDFNV